MRIDLNSGVGQTRDTVATSQSHLRTPSATVRDEAPTDVTNLSPDYQRIQELTGMVNGLPEIRQDKVDALGVMIRNGTYDCTPAETAEALLSHMADAVG